MRQAQPDSGPLLPGKAPKKNHFPKRLRLDRTTQSAGYRNTALPLGTTEPNRVPRRVSGGGVKI